MASFRLIVGLGNPGREYADTRHNVGFMLLDQLAETHGVAFQSAPRWQCHLAKLPDGTLLVKPQTFMNLSGKSVNYWMQQLKIEKDNLLILVDDIALPYDTLRLKPKGSAGGHNGLKSIEATLGTQEYARLRMGVGDDFPKGRQADYVLSNFSSTELDNIPLILDRTSSFIENFCLEGIQKTMNKYNQ